MMKNDVTELTKVKYINMYGNRLDHLRDDEFRVEVKYKVLRGKVLSMTTPSLELFDKLFDSIQKEVVYAETDKEIGDFNRRWGSTWLKLNRTSKIWNDLCGLYYAAAIRKDLLFGSPEEFKQYLEEGLNYDKTSVEYQLASAYLTWKNCKEVPHYYN